MRRSLAALALVLGLMAASCSNAAAPTPQIVYVTPAPTPQIIYVTPAPTPQIVYATPAPLPPAPPTAKPTLRPTARPTALPDMRWQRDPWVPPKTPVCPDPSGWFAYGGDQSHWRCVSGGAGGTIELLPPITNTYLEAMMQAAYAVTSKRVCDRDFPHLYWYAFDLSSGNILLTSNHPGECRDHQ
jgi:hypothetical protein